MENSLIELLRQYGYFAIFISVAIDHTGIPIPLILFSMLAITFGLNIHFVAIVSFIASMTSDLIFYFLGFKILNLVKISRRMKMKKIAKSEKDMIVIMGRYYPIIGRFMAAYWGTINFSFQRFFYLSALGNILTVLVFCYSIYFIGSNVFADFLLDRNNSLTISFVILLFTLTPILLRWMLKKQK